jgi:hypothetical protein
MKSPARWRGFLCAAEAWLRYDSRRKYVRACATRLLVARGHIGAAIRWKGFMDSYFPAWRLRGSICQKHMYLRDCQILSMGVVSAIMSLGPGRIAWSADFDEAARKADAHAARRNGRITGRGFREACQRSHFVCPASQDSGVVCVNDSHVSGNGSGSMYLTKRSGPFR